MNTQKYLEMLREIKDVAFATVDEHGNPQVRIIDIMMVQDEKLYFVTSRGKSFHKQLLNHPKVAITGMTKDYVTIRLNGSVQKAEQTLLDQIFQENPSMNHIYPDASRYILDVFCLDEGYGELFDLSEYPIYRESFAFGKAIAIPKGFEITKNCIECSTCYDICPQQCIVRASPYTIIQENCLHCGYCQENCPVNAIGTR